MQILLCKCTPLGNTFPQLFTTTRVFHDLDKSIEYPVKAGEIMPLDHEEINHARPPIQDLDPQIPAPELSTDCNVWY